MPIESFPAPASTFRLRRRTPGSFILVPCPQAGRSIRCQGQLEAAAATILAACPLVTSIQEQPLAIWYAWRAVAGQLQIQLLPETPRTRRGKEGLRYSHIVPDFLVEMRDGRRRLVEVKPSAKLDCPIVQRKLAVGRLAAAQRGWTFHVVTERELCEGPLLSNVRLLGRYRSWNAAPKLIEQIERIVVDGPIPLAHLIGRADGTPQELRAAVLHLLAGHRLAFDPFAGPFDDQTLLSSGGTRTWDPFDSVWGPSGCATDGPSASSAS